MCTWRCSDLSSNALDGTTHRNAHRSTHRSTHGCAARRSHKRTARRTAQANSDIGVLQRCELEPPHRHAAGRARRAHRPRHAVRPRSPKLAREGKARRGRAPAESVRSRARAVLRSYLGSNGLTGTIGSWIGSLAKLTRLYARARACMGGTPGAAHAHSCGGYCWGYWSTLRRGGCGASCAVKRARALCACVCVCAFMCVCVSVCLCVCSCVRIVLAFDGLVLVCYWIAHI